MKFAEYIGIPWAAGAQGPNEYDCMGFFRMLQEKHFEISVPKIVALDYSDGLALACLFGTHPERSNWPQIPSPTHGCAVIIRRPMHIGTWLDSNGGGVLHCVHGAGVIFTTDSAWHASGFGRKEYFKSAQNDTSNISEKRSCTDDPRNCRI